jgi:hypothetical protein
LHTILRMFAISFENLASFLDRGDIEASRAFLDSVHDSARDDPQYLTFRAELSRRSGDMESALAGCLEISHRYPHWERHRYVMADAAAHLGQVQAVLPTFDRIASNFIPVLGHQVLAEAWYQIGLDEQVAALPREFEGQSYAQRIIRMHAGQSRMRMSGIAAGLNEYREAWTTDAALMDLHGMAAVDTSEFWWGQCALPRRLVMHTRGGIGDYFLWARYLPLLQEFGVEVVHGDEFWFTGMRPEFSSPGVQYAGEDEATAVNEQMWTEPFALFTAFFPRHGYGPTQRYFAPPSDEHSDSIMQSARSKANGKPCWAIFWSANESPGNFAVKSACLPHVLPLLLREDVHWIVIQRGHQMKLWLDDPRHKGATNAVSRLSIDQMASLLAQVDGAVVVDSSVAHVAAALGTPTYLLASRAACWRYEQCESRTPWFESMRLFRQPALGDWNGAVDALGKALPT